MTIGCGADVGPQPSGGSKDAIKHGSAIAKEVTKVINDKMTPLPGVTKTAVKELQLPLQQPKDRKYWQSQLKVGGFYAELAKSMLKNLMKKEAFPQRLNIQFTHGNLVKSSRWYF